MLCESIIAAMQSHRATRTLRLWVLAFFVMALGAAVASPLLQPRSMELVCTGTGSARLVMKTVDGLVAADAAGMDCPLCLAPNTPPSAQPAAPALAAAPAFQPCFDTQFSARGGAALGPPARAPPFFN